jgi:hypothetical protein
MNFFNPSRSKVARTSAFALGLAVVLYASYRVGQAFAEWRQPPATPPVDAAAAFAVNPLAGALVEGGHWSFADLDWDIRSQIVSADDVESKIESLIENLPKSDAEVSRTPDASPDLLRFLKNANLNSTARDDAEIYRLERPTLKVVIILRKIEDRTKALGGIIAYIQNSHKWQSFELSPRAVSARRADSTHLLPLPAGAIQSGARTDANGHLLLEMITTKVSADSLLKDWKQSGWDVRPATLGNNANFSYLCARGNEIVYASSADPADSLEHLILTRSPSDAELQAQTNTPTH